MMSLYISLTYFFVVVNFLCVQISERASHGSMHVVWKFPTPPLCVALFAAVITCDKKPAKPLVNTAGYFLPVAPLN